jgi:drug/metabolite transporter (DMT)-like permease
MDLHRLARQTPAIQRAAAKDPRAMADQSTPDRLRGTAEMTVAMAISGSIGWLVVGSGLPVIDVVFWRCAFAALTLAIVCAVLGVFRRRITRQQFWLAVLGGIAVVSNWLMLFAAYPRASISIATAVYSTQPFMLVLLGAVIFAEALTIAKMLWLCLAFVGVLLIIQAGSGSDLAGSDYLTGIALSLGAAFLYAVAAIIAKRLKGVPPHVITLIQVSVGIVMLAPMANFHSLPTEAGTWQILMTLGVVHTGLMFTLMYSAVQRLPTHLTGSLVFIYPVVAIIVDHFAFGHRLELTQWIGVAVILSSAAALNLGWMPWRRWVRIRVV